MKRSNTALLLLVPALVLVFNVLFLVNQRKLYLSWPDPSYAYLFNGMNIANGKLEVGHIDHPGTTVQEFAGLVIRTTYIFSGEKETLTADLLTNPEKYLRIVCYCYILLSCIVLFLCGRVIFKRSGNIALALFFQGGTLFFFTTLAGMPDLRPEGFLVMGTMILVTICFSFLSEESFSNRKMFGYAIRFGAVCAFLAVTKITSLPLLMLPLFLLRKWKSWFVYGFSLVGFALLFLIPALKKMIFFFQWMRNLFFHSGIYGAGEEKIIDAKTFREDLIYIFTGDIGFAIGCVLLLVTLLALLFSKRFTFSTWKTNPRMRLMTGVFLAAIICALMVAKHFKYHYLIPAYGIMTLGAWLALPLLFSKNGKLYDWLHNRKIQLAVVLALIFGTAAYDAKSYYFFKGLMNPKMETANEMAKYKDLPRIYVTLENPAAEPSPSLLFGLAYSGDMAPVYITELKKDYPKSYFFLWDQQLFRDWGNTIEPLDIVERYPKVLVSFYYTDDAIITGTLDRIMQLNRDGQVVEIHKVYENKRTGEQLYLLTRTGSTPQTDSSKTISCDAETVLANSLVSNNQQYRFQGAEARTDKAAHSGKFSLELNKTNAYGFGYQLPVVKGKMYELTAWKKSAEDHGVLVASAKDAKVFYYSGSTVVEDGGNGWKKVRLRFQVPDNFQDSTLSVFAWVENGDNVCYFDDFEVKEFK